MKATGEEVFTAAKYTRPAVQTKIPNIQTENSVARTFEEKCQVFFSTLFPASPPHPSVPSNTAYKIRLNQSSNTSQLSVLSFQNPQRSTSSASKGQENKVWPWPKLNIKAIKYTIVTSSAKKAPGPDKIGFAII